MKIKIKKIDFPPFEWWNEEKRYSAGFVKLIINQGRFVIKDYSHNIGTGEYLFKPFPFTEAGYEEAKKEFMSIIKTFIQELIDDFVEDEKI